MVKTFAHTFIFLGGILFILTLTLHVPRKQNWNSTLLAFRPSYQSSSHIVIKKQNDTETSAKIQVKRSLPSPVDELEKTDKEVDYPYDYHTFKENYYNDLRQAGILFDKQMADIEFALKTGKKKTVRTICDNPTVIEAFNCIWQDLKYLNITVQTTKKTLKVNFIWLTPVFILLFILLCCCMKYICKCLMSPFVSYIDRSIERSAKKIQSHKPGVWKHSDGTIENYPPTLEEINAYEDLIEAFQMA